MALILTMTHEYELLLTSMRIAVLLPLRFDLAIQTAILISDLTMAHTLYHILGI